MAWSDPVTLNTGDLVSEAHWNTHVNDLFALRTGGIAISGQAAGYIPFASSAVAGHTTRSPGQWVNSDAPVCE